jgi:hypothetical protein
MHFGDIRSQDTMESSLNLTRRREKKERPLTVAALHLLEKLLLL